MHINLIIPLEIIQVTYSKINFIIIFLYFLLSNIWINMKILVFKNRKTIKEKYYKNKIFIYELIISMNKSYVSKSVNFFNRLNKNYLFSDYIYRNKNKISICVTIYKYNIKIFSFYIL